MYTNVFCLLIIVFLFGIGTSKGQADKAKILSAFQQFDYYPDSTIKCAYKIKKERKHGYAIEFDSTGAPDFIGEYKRGKRKGSWMYADARFKSYKKKYRNILSFYPGCGTGVQLAKSRFKKMYRQLINNEKVDI